MAARITFLSELRPPPAKVSTSPATIAALAPDLPAPASGPGTAKTATDAAVNVTVRGQSTAERLRQSAEAVKVVELEHARRESADLGEVLARTPGVGVRRTGGLGSDVRFSLNGLSDDQVRIFVDGIPLEYTGYALGIGNVPVNLVKQIEIHGGVVPIRFGADTLGGAVNLVTAGFAPGWHGAASYQLGSYGTHRITVSSQHLGASGFSARLNAFVDRAKNDYPVDVEVPNAVGRPVPVRAKRFHDAYSATGVNADVGWIGLRWAQRSSSAGSSRPTGPSSGARRWTSAVSA